MRNIFLALVIVTAAARSASAITGSVYGPDGKAVSGAVVTLFPAETREAEVRRLLSGTAERKPLAGPDGAPLGTRTDQAGHFALAATAGTITHVAIDAEGFAPERLTVWADRELTVALRRAAVVTGRVRAEGKPVSGATVIWSGRNDARVSAVTSADGTYRIADPAIWADSVVVLHPDFAPLVPAQIEWPRRRKTEHDLTRGAVLKGSVLDTAGKPVSQAELLIDGIPSGKSGENGSFELPHVPAEWNVLEARSARGVAAVKRQAAPIVLRLQAGRVVEGKVRSTDGKPMAGALVFLRGDGGDAVIGREVISGASGEFRFDAVTPGRYGVWATAPDFVLAATEGRMNDLTADVRSATAASVSVVLKPLVQISGRVVDADGNGVQGARVTAGPPEAPSFADLVSEATAAITGPDGRFLLPFDGNGVDRLQLTVRHAGFAPGRSAALQLENGKVSPVTIRLDRGLELTIAVLNPAGAPVPAAVVAWSPLESTSGFRVPVDQLFTVADRAFWPAAGEDGRVVVRVAAGEYDFAARANGYQVGARKGVAVRESSTVKLILEAGAAIRGTVVREDGSAVAGARVMVIDDRRVAREEPAVTSAGGAFTIADLPPGDHRLMVFKQDELIEQSVSVRAPSANLRVVVPAAERVSGRVIDLRSRQPLQSFTIILERSPADDARRPSATSRSFVDANGAFTFDHIPEGDLRITARAEGFIPSTTLKRSLRRGEPLELEITLDAGAEVSGRVTDEGGMAVADAPVSINPADGEGEPVEGSSDERGEFRLAGVTPGTVQLAVQKEGFIASRRELKVEGRTRADVTLSRGLTLRGVVMLDGNPVADAEVSMSSPAFDAGGQSTSSGASGEFSISGLAPGAYNVSAYKEGTGRAELRDVDVRRTPQITIELKKRQTATIYGRVSGLDESEQYVVRMVAASSDEGYGQSGIASDGSYRIESAPTGTVRVTAQLQSQTTSMAAPPKVVEVSPGAEVQVDLSLAERIVVRGRVTRNGAPLVGATVVFSRVGAEEGVTATTDFEGDYTASVGPPGNYRMSVHSREQRTPHFAFETISGARNIDVELRDLEVEGVVVDSADGSPVKGVRLLLMAEHADEPFFGAPAVTDEAGRFELVASAAGMYRLVAERDGYGQVSRELTLDGSVRGMRVELSRNDGVTVRIVEAGTGRILSGNLIVRDKSGKVVLTPYRAPRADGSTLLPLSPGTYRVTAMVWQYAARAITVELPQSGVVDLAVNRGGTLVVVNPRELQGSVRLAGPDGLLHPFCCDGGEQQLLQGTWTVIEHVAAGSWTALVTDVAGREIARMPVIVPEGAAVELRLEN